jgi:phosphatidyl-myo-inositol dimannoside synthase
MGPSELHIGFFYLSAFNKTGGIEKFNRCFCKALDDLACEERWKLSVTSMYDSTSDDKYVSKQNFKGFGKKRFGALMSVIAKAYKYDVLVIGHINLAVAGLIVKLLNPSCKIILVSHGIESWIRLYGPRKWGLLSSDRILAVSNYTKNQLILRNGINGNKVKLFPNCLDPYFNPPINFKKPLHLINRYNIEPQQKVIYTLCRLLTSEQNKGYDKVIRALPEVIRHFPRCIYILAGKFDIEEKRRLDELIEIMGIKGKVLLPGFITDSEIEDHYKLADVFILPSRKEGFGIVFLESLACGTPIIGGNQDGTVDALFNGALGQLINPTKQKEITTALLKQLSNEVFNNPEQLQQGMSETYQFSSYKARLKELVNSL